MSMLDRIAKVLAGKIGGPHPGGIRMYHSSPHDVNTFDARFIGTGEGGAAFGKGIYGAESPQVSGRGGNYWGQFLDRFPRDEMNAAYILHNTGFSRAEAIDKAQRDIERLRQLGPGRFKDEIANQQRALDLLRSDKPVLGPRTYELNYRAQPAELLDWDKPLSRQSPELRQALGDVAERVGIVHRRGEFPETTYADTNTGADFYTDVGRRLTPSRGEQKSSASEALDYYGIPGIRYLDRDSRNIPPMTADATQMIAEHGSREAALNVARERIKAGGLRAGTPEAQYWQGMTRQLANPPTYNYVMFDPSKIDIVAKYGIVGGAGLGMGAVAAQDQYGAQQ